MGSTVAEISDPTTKKTELQQMKYPTRNQYASPPRGNAIPAGWVSQIRTLTPNFTVVTLKCGLITAPKSPKLVIFGINLPKRGIPPSAIFTKFRLGEGLPGLHLHAKIYRCGFKYVPPKSIICAPKGYIPSINFYKIWRRGGPPRSSQSLQLSPVWL